VNDSELAGFKQWFDDYVQGFYDIDPVIDANVELKYQHTLHTCEEMRYLTTALELPHNEHLLAETVALFHDLARFEQFRDYRTFVDAVSLNHGCHAVYLLGKLGLLAALPHQEQDMVTTAIGLHNAKVIPDDLSPEVLLLTRLIRDADKMDIYRIFHHYCEQLRDDPENFKANLDLPVTSEYTPAIMKSLLGRKPIDYSALRTSTDVTILHMAWIYDINFVPSLRRIMDRGHLAELISHMPDDPDVRTAITAVMAYMEEKIASGAILAADR
jgi:hypothetical protein